MGRTELGHAIFLARVRSGKTQEECADDFGIPAEVAETIVGHANVLGRSNDVMQTYIHVSDDDLIREIAKLSYPEIENG